MSAHVTFPLQIQGLCNSKYAAQPLLMLKEAAGTWAPSLFFIYHWSTATSFLHIWLVDVFKPVNMDDDTRGLQIKGLYEGLNEMCYRFRSKPLFLTAAPSSLTSDPMQHLQRTSFTHRKSTLHFSTPGRPHDTVATPCMWHQLYYHLTRRTAPVAKSASG